jgi:hypothetical protein
MKTPAMLIPEAMQPLLAGLILWIATTNLFNRVNATTKQVAGDNPWKSR